MKRYKNMEAIKREWNKQLAKHGKHVVPAVPFLTKEEVCEIFDDDFLSDTTNGIFIASKSQAKGVYFSTNLLYMNKKDAKKIILHELAHYFQYLLYSIGIFGNHDRKYRKLCRSIRGITGKTAVIYYTTDTPRLWLGKPKYKAW